MATPRDIVGSSPALRAALARAEQAAASDVPVLLTGESGTGKEVLARHVHACSARGTRSFVAVNATALPFHLLESELFGHERGAFTGADRARAGLFQAAHHGTLLIDEIGDLPLPLQAKLLRVLQEGEVRPVGRNDGVPVDVRIVSATHRDLAALVRRGEFRQDLFYRISVFPVDVPPLRERLDDVVPLARHLLDRHGGKGARLTAAAAAALERHGWPGNVRELENACRHALVLCRGGDVLPEHLPRSVLERQGPTRPALTIWQARADAERERILGALAAVEGNRTLAARRLGMSRQALHDRLRRYGIGAGAGRPEAAAAEDG